MNDEASRRQQRYQGLRRRHGTAPGHGRTPGTGGNTPTQPGDPIPRESIPPHPGEGESLERGYARAVAAMNDILTSRDFALLPWITNVFHAAADALDEGDPARAGVLNNLGSASQLAYLRSGQPADLDGAVRYYRAAVSSAHDDDSDLVLYLGNLSLALIDQASRTGSADSAREAVSAARRANELAPVGDSRRAMALVRLANALKTHARVAEDVGSDDESIEVFRDAARASSSADRVDLLVNLGSALLRRYERQGSAEDLDEGIEQLRAGVDGLADGEPRRRALCQLATALRLRFRRIGDLTDLTAAINELIGVLDVLDPGHRLTGRVVWSLACAVAEYTDCTAEPAPLRRALRSIDPAVRALAERDPDRSVAIAGFGALLRRHFLHGGAANALDAAVSAGEAALRATERGPRRCVILESLMTTLITRYELNGDPTDLDRAAEVADATLELCPDDGAPAHSALAQLGVIAAHRYRAGSAVEQLEHSITMLERALNTMPETAPQRATVALHLASSLHALHQLLGRRRPYRWARKVLTDAAEQPTAPADQRLRAARSAGRIAAEAHRWSEALESFGTAVELLPLITRGKRIVATPKAQRQWSMLAADAAACALECGKAELAVELLEHGRTALLSDFLPNGGELGKLHRAQPELTDRSIRLRRLLDRPAEEPLLADLDATEVEERRHRASAWEALLHEIRFLPGHEEHLRPTPFPQLTAAAGYGAVVLVNLSHYRSDALVVYGGRVLTIPLPEVTPDSAQRWAATALAAARGGQPKPLAEALDWCWQHITRPVLDRVGHREPPADGQPWPRVWWNVHGPLAFLPLHAATSLSGESALDRVVSSYTPTLGTLARALRRPLPESGSPLIAAGSSEQISRELPRSNRVLARYWPEAEVVSTESTDVASFLQALPRHPWVHVREPSAQDPEQPASGLLLERESPERSLGIIDLGPVPLDLAEFGYLERTRTVSDTPSAAGMPLAATLGFAGFTHVISSLWQTDEDTAGWVHEEVYGQLFGGDAFDTDSSAHALHTAAFRLRDQYPDDPARWAAHLHIGP